MTTKAVKFRVHDGNLEPFEKLSLPEGSEVTLVVHIPDAGERHAERVQLEVWNLGHIGPLTREAIHEDAF